MTPAGNPRRREPQQLTNVRTSGPQQAPHVSEAVGVGFSERGGGSHHLMSLCSGRARSIMIRSVGHVKAADVSRIDPVAALTNGLDPVHDVGQRLAHMP